MGIEEFPSEKFTPVGISKDGTYGKISEKGRGYFRDAMLRFRKNRSSVAAAYIILFLLLFALFSPIISPYGINDKDTVYTGFPPYLEKASWLPLGLFDGGTVRTGQSEAQLAALRAIGEETGMDPVIKIKDREETVTKFRGEERRTVTYALRVNKYYEVGIMFRVMSPEEFLRIQEYQNKTGLQIIYPYTDRALIGAAAASPNVWYRVSDAKGTPMLDSDGELIPAYSTDKSTEGAPYSSIRIEGDDGELIYSRRKSGAVECRVCYYNYYIFANGHPPTFPLGTNSLGQDLFSAIGIGARFSLLFALIVSALNLIIGTVYGAVQGYYGGTVDLVLDRAADILSGMPFIVVATLFQLHLASRVGTVGSFLFAFVLTGWIGMAALTRKQFYRFKGREFVLAARTLGASDRRLMVRHIFPNAIGTLITSCALIIPGVIGSETTFSYLGIINLSEFAGTSLGTLMSQGQTSMTTSPHAMLFPALYFSLLLISFNLFGNGLRDAFDPRVRGAEDL